MLSKIIFWLIALSFIPCIYLTYQKHLSILAAQKLHGIVVGYDTRISHDSKKNTDKKLYALRVEYIDRGVKYQMTSSTASDQPSKDIGDPVVVLHYSDGSGGSLFLFGDIFTPYWIWLCIAMSVGGVQVGTAVMNWLYYTFHIEYLVPYDTDAVSSGVNMQAKLLACWVLLCIVIGVVGFFIGTPFMEWLYLSSQNEHPAATGLLNPDAIHRP
jgi:hypothetical protein